MLPDGQHPLTPLLDEVLRTQGRIKVASANLGVAEGLSGAQLTVLTAVVRAARPPTVPQIGRSLGHSRQAVQRLADMLVDSGLIAFVDNPDHKRAHRLVPTESGLAAYKRIDERSQDWIVRITHGMDHDDIIAATRTLRGLRRRLEADSAGRPRSE